MDRSPYCFIVVLIALATGCYRNTIQQPRLITVKTVTPSGPFEWSPIEKKNFLARLQRLKPGDEVDEVIALIGPPYCTQPNTIKESDKTRGTSVKYYLKKIGDAYDSNEKYDQLISLQFDVAGSLIAIDTNIRGLEFGPLTGINTEGTELDNQGR
jgi:hypothetical protein